MIDANEISGLLARKYAPPSWAYLPQVRNGTGYQRSTIRYADGIAMSLWPSRGMEIEGFEIKVSRSDWISELNNPEKAEYFVKICDRWWIVAPEGIVVPGELPAPWGLMVAKGRRLYVKTAAPKLEAAPLDRIQLAAIMRSLQAVATPEGKLEEARKLGYEDGRKGALESMSYEMKESRRFAEKVRDFEKASGVRIDEYSSSQSIKNIGEAVRIVLAGQDMEVRKRILDFRNQLSEMIEICDKTLEEK